MERERFPLMYLQDVEFVRGDGFALRQPTYWPLRERSRRVALNRVLDLAPIDAAPGVVPGHRSMIRDGAP